MRIANRDDRAHVVIEESSLSFDIAQASAGKFGPSLASLYESWPEFASWAAAFTPDKGALVPFTPHESGPPSPAPRQVFAVALNYVNHAAESGFKPPENPLFFTKYVSAFTGASSTVALPEGKVDWECELVAVISRPARLVPVSDGWDYVAGVTVGQDISERVLQRSGPAPQYGLAKSHPGFAPTGPVLVTPDEFVDRDDLEIGCTVNGQSMQSARTSDMIFGVGALVSYLSGVVTLMPGDVIFTGTPPGVGMGRDPQIFLRPGDVLRSRIEGIGEMVQTFVGR